MTLKRLGPLLLIGTVLVLLGLLILAAAQSIENSPTAARIVSDLGYGGVILIAIVAGLNVIVPIPAVTLTPIFTAGGLWLPGIILALTLGTLMADYLGFLFGRWSKDHIYKNYPLVIGYLEQVYTTRPHLLLPGVFLFAAFVPLPNEVMLIPLAFLAVRWRLIVLPLFCGNLLNQAIYAYGVQTIFAWLL